MPGLIEMVQVLIPIAGMGLAALFLIGAYRTVNRWLDRRHERALAEAAGAGELPEQLGRRLELLDDLAYRVQELEERVDFAERVLVERRDRRALPQDAGDRHGSV